MRSLPRPRLVPVALSLLTLLVVASGLTYFLRATRYSYPTFDFGTVPDHGCDAGTGIANLDGKPNQPIPNFVHYVWLLKDPAELRLGFKLFVSMYSANILWKPDGIYFHTDAAPEVIEKARVSGTPWTKRILEMPGLIFNHVEAPAVTTKGVKIVKMEHKADFLRLAALRDYGGVYLDADAIPLRDIADLRNSGFRNVVGGQTGITLRFSGYLNNGVMMSVPHSNMMTLFYHASHQFFTGEWDTASIHLLTDLANRMATIPSEVLILQPQAFDPTSWEYDDQKRLFLPAMDPLPSNATLESQTQDQQSDLASSVGACRDALAWLKQREMLSSKDKWELDFSSTYVLHAFDNWVPSILGAGRTIDVKYVLARQSNYARAVFPMVWRAVQEGLISREEVG
ncbi:hypothetical protein NW759_014889 [Fusarium solani]|nr:hypothetical protein NW759_014889 [Fusarium solani]